jgi:hypothetical protein
LEKFSKGFAHMDDEVNDTGSRAAGSASVSVPVIGAAEAGVWSHLPPDVREVVHGLYGLIDEIGERYAREASQEPASATAIAMRPRSPREIEEIRRCYALERDMILRHIADLTARYMRPIVVSADGLLGGPRTGRWLSAGSERKPTAPKATDAEA